ncbi:MAG: lamin tail domain-containing protein [Candidatus Izemoplasmatales bacterium]
MKFNKKLLSFIFLALFAVVLIGCNGDETTLEPTDAPTTTEAPTEAPTEEPTEEPTQAPTEEPTEAPTEEPTEAPTDEPTEAPTEEPTEEPTTEEPTTEEPTLPVTIEVALNTLIMLYDEFEDDTYVVTSDVTFRQDVMGYAVTWESSDTDYLANDGTVTRPTKTVGDQTLFLDVTLSYGSQEEMYTFIVTIGALEDYTDQEYADQVFLVATAFPNKEVWTFADSLILPETGTDKDGNEYDITWSSSHPAVITAEGAIIPDDTQATTVTMTASITINDEEFTADAVFNVGIMPTFDVDTNSIATALAEANVGSYVRITGVTVIGISSNGYFYTDGEDIGFAYASGLPAEINDVVDIFGSVTEYYGYMQLQKDPTDGTKVVWTVPSTEAISTPKINAGTIDTIIADGPAAAGDYKLFGMYEITGRVYYAPNNSDPVFLVPSDYDFENDYAANAKPVGPALEVYDYANDTELIPFHGFEVTIHVIPNGYHSGHSNHYVWYVYTKDEVVVSFDTDQDRIDAALNTLMYPQFIIEDETLPMPESVLGVDFTYASSNEAIINPTTGAVTVGETFEVVTLTVTATYGTTTDTLVVEIPVGIPAVTTIADALSGDKGELFNLEGIVVAGGYHGLFFIQDETGNVAIYLDSYSDDYATITAMLEANVGNEVSVLGTRDTYGGLNQIRVMEIEYLADATMVTETNIDTLTLDSDGILVHQGKLVELTEMVITDVYEDKYGNITITLERISDQETIKMKWDSRYDLPEAVETGLKALKVGDKVAVTTVLGWSYGPQLLFTTTTEVIVTELSDAQKVAYDVNNTDTEMVLESSIDFGTGEYGSVMEVVEIFGTAANFIDLTTTPGTLIVTQPYGTEVSAVMTVKVSSGTEEEIIEIQVTIPAISISATTTDLIISEYGEGSSNNKWLEIYNGTGADVDLSNYSIEYYSNGSTADPLVLPLSGTLANGEVFVLTTDQAKTEIQALADLVNSYPSVVHFNGDDAVVLVNDGTAIDTVLNVGHPKDDKVAAELTWVRKSSVLSGTTTFDVNEWNVLAQDDYSNLGTHSLDVMVMTDQVKVEADLAELDQFIYVYTAQDITLPTTGTFGSAIAWAEVTDEGNNASLAGNVLSLLAIAEYTTAEVVIEATLTLNDVTETALFTIKLVGETDTDKVAQDKAELEALELGGVAYVGVSASLPNSCTKGSTITWAITTDVDTLATLTAADLAIARAEGTDSTVVLTATLTKGTETATVTVTYTMKAEITDFTELHAMTDGVNYDIPTDLDIVIKGIVVADIYDGFFIQDANGVGILVDGLDATVGDEVIYSGNLTLDYGVRVFENGAELSVVSTGNDLVYTTMTADEIIALDASAAGTLITFTGLEVVEYSADYPYSVTFKVTGTTETINLTLRFFSSYASWLQDVYEVGDVLPEVSFVYYNFRESYNQIEALEIELSNAQAIELDAADVPETLVLDANFEIPTAEYGSTYTITGITGDAATYLDYTTTPGTIELLSQPAIGAADAEGVITVEVTLGTETAIVKTIAVTVKAEVASGTITELFISEYGEGGSNNKWIEIYNGTDSAIDLTPYKVVLYSNGSATYGNSIDLTGTLAAGEVLVIYNSGSIQAIIDEGDVTSTVTYFNGDDAVALLKNEVVIDAFGVIGEDPGSSWTVGTGSTVNHTLVRKATVFGPTTTWDPTEWDVYPQDTTDYIGSHTTQ